jgi:hypothetical protein
MHPISPAHALELVAGLIAIMVLTPVLIAGMIGLIVYSERLVPVPQENPWLEARRSARREPLQIDPRRT